MYYSFDDRRSISTEGKAIILHIFILICFLNGFYSSLKASISTENIPYGITYPSGTFNTDNPVTFTIWAGSQSQQLESIVGFDLTFTLTNHAFFPSSMTPNFSNSWIADDDSMSVSIELNTHAKTIRIIGQRTHDSRNGHGEIVSFTLYSASNQVSASQLLTGEGGGIVITIEDVIMRKASPFSSASVSLAIYPNPSTGKVLASSEKGEIISMLLLDLVGRQISVSNEPVLDLRQLGIPKGKYWLVVTLDSGETIHKPLVFSP